MYIDLVVFRVIILVIMMCAVEISACVGVFGCGYPSSMSVVCIETANFALMNSALNSASAAKLITALVICKTCRTALLFCGMSSSLDMKNLIMPLNYSRKVISMFLANVFTP